MLSFIYFNYFIIFYYIIFPFNIIFLTILFLLNILYVEMKLGVDTGKENEYPREEDYRIIAIKSV